MAQLHRPLTYRRVIAGYTQERLAEVLGVDRSTIGRWERGEQLPQPGQRPGLAHKLGVTLDHLDSLLRARPVGPDLASDSMAARSVPDSESTCNCSVRVARPECQPLSLQQAIGSP
ncbi:helix-turn-helix transcriptional regulator [Actinoalloteichus caeruleus]|uniref:helix-turn-helix transcriptional regulator n=1 Tax=Actinoalloteichus cyanogriseus TaxID=2893586 RepID=UPI003AAA5E24